MNPSAGATRQQSLGFTLVEVLVAVAVVAVALGAGMRAAGSVIDNAQRLQDVIAAQWCADNYLANLKLAKQVPGVGEIEFACEQLGRSYRGTMIAATTPNPNFRRIDAVIRNADGQTLVMLSTVVSPY
ncbi:MAG: type II secretion system minor pseudopilin GspI [Rubrivivax sp.]